MKMTPIEDVPQFLETWQATLQEVAIANCFYTNVQQVNLLLGALLEIWSTFITTQVGLDDLTFTNLLSNILQQNNINNSMQSNSKAKSTSSFYIKGKFIKPMIQLKSSKFQKYTAL